jgi:hypothetical protein
LEDAIAGLSELDRLRDRLLVLFLEVLPQGQLEQGLQEQHRQRLQYGLDATI